MRPLIVMALESEGQGLLEPLGLDVVYCGVGKVNAAYHLLKALHAPQRTSSFDLVLNLGTAGSTTYPYGHLVEAHRFVQRDMDATGIGFAAGETPFDPHPPALEFPKRYAHLPSATCGSGDSFLQGASPIPCEVIDMEAYALAKVCHLEVLPFTSVKFITDGADGEAHLDWQENLRHAAQAFHSLLIS
jgi:adenosylhomocysteine nucleosidase